MTVLDGVEAFALRCVELAEMPSPQAQKIAAEESGDDSLIGRARRLQRIRTLARSNGARAERRLILLSAATRETRLANGACAQRLAGEVRWARLAETLRVRRLLPTLGPRLLELAGHLPGEGFAEAVRGSLEATRRQAAMLELVCGHVSDALTEAGIASSPLKGPMLATAIYGDIGRRVSSDLDVLVAPGELHGAVEVVRRLGYRKPRDWIDKDGLPSMHFALSHGEGLWPAIELHWRVHWYERRFASERLLPARPGALGSWRPHSTDELAMMLLLYAREGFVDLRLAADLATWWDSFGPGVEATGMRQILEIYPALAPAIVTAALVAERTVALPASEILGERPALGVRERIAMRLANPNPQARRSQLHAEMGLVDGLLMPASDVRAFARRQLLLPREVFDELAESTPGWRSKSPLRHCAHVLVRFGLGLARLWRRPEALR